ncbi:winged helix-turn-helix domain-containing protein [Mucilaginibacter sp.]|uniref:winged helix-turn-helix domain-containing protein n=1 Tax=Mucilaginibacter sp. TaxID=1882438 RepID=UPI002ED39AC0
MLNFKADKEISVPVVAQIVQAITTGILNGVLVQGKRLPSINQFSKQFAVSRDSVEKAYKKLKISGMIISVPGKGNYVSGLSGNNEAILIISKKMFSSDKTLNMAFLTELEQLAMTAVSIREISTEKLQQYLEDYKHQLRHYLIAGAIPLLNVMV